MKIIKEIKLAKIVAKENIIDIPMIKDLNRFDKSRNRAEKAGFEHCPCCGKAIKNKKYFINSAYGGSAYPAKHKEENISDCWVMAVGSECRKKFPKGYVFQNK